MLSATGSFAMSSAAMMYTLPSRDMETSSIETTAGPLPTKRGWMLAAALGKLRSDEAYAALAEAADKAQHPKARRGVIRALGHFRMPKAAELLRRFALRDPSYLV